MKLCSADLVGAFWAASMLAGCTGDGAGIFTANSEARIGGEAKFEGDLGYAGGCLQLLTSDHRRWTLIFAEQTSAGDGLIVNPSFGLVRIPSNGMLITGSALRDNGVGWSSKSIGKVLQVKLPPKCARNVIYVVKIEPSKL